MSYTPTSKEIEKETERLFMRHVKDVMKNHPGEDFEDISQFCKADFEQEAVENLVRKYHERKLRLKRR